MEQHEIGRILCICPSFKRVKMCSDMLRSYKSTTHGNSDVILGLSKNDPTIPEYIELAKEFRVGYQIFDSNSTTFIFNKIWAENQGYAAYHMQNDDVIYHTPKWDWAFAANLQQLGGGIVYGNDQFHGADLCTLPCISANVANALGWLQYDKLDKLFGDAVWMRIGIFVPCLIYQHQVIMEHVHWINGKRANDVTGQEYLKGYKSDEFIFNFWLNNFSEHDIAKVKEALK